MDKTLAVITVIITDSKLEETGASSGSAPLGDGINWRVELRPNADKAIDPSLWQPKNSAPTILAHELGHVISRLFNDPREAQANRLLAAFGIPSAIVPAEKRAWELAEIMYPELSKELKSRALAAYGVK